MFPVLVLVSIVSTANPPRMLSIAELAKYLRLVASNAGCPGRIACKDVDIAMQLKKDGISVDARSSVAWASSGEQVRTFLEEHKFIICSDPEFLQRGASLAIFHEQGKLVLALHMKNARATGVQLSPDLIKVARIL